MFSWLIALIASVVGGFIIYIYVCVCVCVCMYMLFAFFQKFWNSMKLVSENGIKGQVFFLF